MKTILKWIGITAGVVVIGAILFFISVPEAITLIVKPGPPEFAKAVFDFKVDNLNMDKVVKELTNFANQNDCTIRVFPLSVRGRPYIRVYLERADGSEFEIDNYFASDEYSVLFFLHGAKEDGSQNIIKRFKESFETLPAKTIKEEYH